MSHKRKSQATGASNRIRVRQGEARVWFYRNESSIDVYVRSAEAGQTNKPAAIVFRISSRDFVGR
jgi:hypothetical protein